MRLRFTVFTAMSLVMLVLPLMVLAAPKNIVPNPDFVKDAEGWSFGADYGTFKVDPSVKGIVGNAVLAKVDKVGANAWEPEIHSPGFDLKNGVKYTYAFWAKAEAGKTRVLGARFEQLDTWVGIGEDITINDQWKDYRFTGVWTHPGSPPQVVIHIAMNVPPEPLVDVWFSNFRVYEGDYVVETTPVNPMGRLATAWGSLKNK